MSTSETKFSVELNDSYQLCWKLSDPIHGTLLEKKFQLEFVQNESGTKILLHTDHGASLDAFKFKTFLQELQDPNGPALLVLPLDHDFELQRLTYNRETQTLAFHQECRLPPGQFLTKVVVQLSEGELCQPLRKMDSLLCTMVQEQLCPTCKMIQTFVGHV